MRNCKLCGKEFQRSRPDANRQNHCSLFCRWLCRVSIPSVSECWTWLGAKAHSGYGAMRVEDKVVTAHRFILGFVLNREITAHVLHACDNRQCCNPFHLREGSAADNTADTWNRKRHAWFRWTDQERAEWVKKMVSNQSRSKLLRNSA